MGEQQSTAVHWQKDSDAPACTSCGSIFSFSLRRHHCRSCGFIFCADCSNHLTRLPHRGIHDAVRVCDGCHRAVAERRARQQQRHRNTSASPSVIPPRSAVANPTTSASLPTSSTAAAAPSKTAEPVEVGAALSHDPPSALSLEEQQRLQQYYMPEEDLAPPAAATGAEEITEGEWLEQRFARVRQETHFVDVQLQRTQRVMSDTMVEYSRETEGIKLREEVSREELGKTLLPLPTPLDCNSARYLMQPVKPIALPVSACGTAAYNVLEAAAAAIGAKVATTVPPTCVRRPCSADFDAF